VDKKEEKNVTKEQMKGKKVEKKEEQKKQMKIINYEVATSARKLRNRI
jgi:hypothetical protein